MVRFVSDVGVVYFCLSLRTDPLKLTSIFFRLSSKSMVLFCKLCVLSKQMSSVASNCVLFNLLYLPSLYPILYCAILRQHLYQRILLNATHEMTFIIFRLDRWGIPYSKISDFGIHHDL